MRGENIANNPVVGQRAAHNPYAPINEGRAGGGNEQASVVYRVDQTIARAANRSVQTGSTANRLDSILPKGPPSHQLTSEVAAELNEEESALINHLRELHSEIKDLSVQLLPLCNNIQTIRARHDQLNTTQTAEIGTIQSQIDSIKEQIKNLEKSVGQAEKDLLIVSFQKHPNEWEVRATRTRALKDVMNVVAVMSSLGCMIGLPIAGVRNHWFVSENDPHDPNTGNVMIGFTVGLMSTVAISGVRSFAGSLFNPTMQEALNLYKKFMSPIPAAPAAQPNVRASAVEMV